MKLRPTCDLKNRQLFVVHHLPKAQTAHSLFLKIALNLHFLIENVNFSLNLHTVYVV